MQLTTLFGSLLGLALVASTAANPLEARQTTNTNTRINTIITSLTQAVHAEIPAIQRLQGAKQANDATIGPRINRLATAFNTTTTNLQATPVSSGSTTVHPTNDDLSNWYSAALVATFTGLSGLTTATVPSLATFIANLDTPMAASAVAFNTTLPNGAALVRIQLLDSRQFLVRLGLTKTNAAFGF